MDCKLLLKYICTFWSTATTDLERYQAGRIVALSPSHSGTVSAYSEGSLGGLPVKPSPPHSQRSFPPQSVEPDSESESQLGVYNTKLQTCTEY